MLLNKPRRGGRIIENHIVRDKKMGHTYSNLMYHCIFSTKHRQAFLTTDIISRLVEFTGGIIRKRNGNLLAMNGTTDHVHLFAIFNAKDSVSDQLRDIKAGSSGWIHDTFPDLTCFAWQEGYGAFSVSQSNIESVITYIKHQQEHHKTISFEEEFTAFLAKHKIEYDPKYVFD